MISLLQPRVISLPGHVQSVYMQNVLKIFSHVAQVAAFGEEHVGEEEDDQPPERTKACFMTFGTSIQRG